MGTCTGQRIWGRAQGGAYGDLNRAAHMGTCTRQRIWGRAQGGAYGDVHRA
ncbi:uncharacterized, partial [Tachysurus ichikawai]